MCDREAAAASATAHKKLFEDYCVVNYIERDEYGGPEGRAFDATKYTCQCDV